MQSNLMTVCFAVIEEDVTHRTGTTGLFQLVSNFVTNVTARTLAVVGVTRMRFF